MPSFDGRAEYDSAAPLPRDVMVGGGGGAGGTKQKTLDRHSNPRHMSRYETGIRKRSLARNTNLIFALTINNNITDLITARRRRRRFAQSSSIEQLRNSSHPDIISSNNKFNFYFRKVLSYLSWLILSVPSFITNYKTPLLSTHFRADRENPNNFRQFHGVHQQRKNILRTRENISNSNQINLRKIQISKPRHIHHNKLETSYDSRSRFGVRDVNDYSWKKRRRRKRSLIPNNDQLSSTVSSTSRYSFFPTRRSSVSAKHTNNFFNSPKSSQNLPTNSVRLPSISSSFSTPSPPFSSYLPYASVRWTEQPKSRLPRVSLDRKGATLLIQNVQRKDQVEYRCTIHYRKSPSVTHRLRLEVESK